VPQPQRVVIFVTRNIDQKQKEGGVALSSDSEPSVRSVETRSGGRCNNIHYPLFVPPSPLFLREASKGASMGNNAPSLAPLLGRRQGHYHLLVLHIPRAGHHCRPPIIFSRRYIRAPAGKGGAPLEPEPIGRGFALARGFEAKSLEGRSPALANNAAAAAGAAASAADCSERKGCDYGGGVL